MGDFLAEFLETHSIISSSSNGHASDDDDDDNDDGGGGDTTSNDDYSFAILVISYLFLYFLLTHVYM
jgi:hypothetical protein